MASVSRLCLIAVCLTAVVTAEEVCSFSLERMYVPEANQTQFPAGFLACLDANNATIARCEDCACREILTVKNGGNVVTWGLCVENKNATTCGAPQVLCNGEGRAMPETSDATAAAASAPISSKPMMQTVTSAYRPENVESDDTKTQVTEKPSPSPTAAILVGSVVAAAAVVGFALYRARRQKPKEAVMPTHPDFFVFDSPSKPCAPPSTEPMTPPPASDQRDTLDTDEFVVMDSYDDARSDFDSQRSLYSAAFGKFIMASPGSDLFADTMRSMAVDEDCPTRDPPGDVDLVLTSDSAFSDLYFGKRSTADADRESSATSITFYEETTRR